jgi:hypothetical protein
MKNTEKMVEIQGLRDFNTIPTELDTKRVENLINRPLDKNLEKLCELLAKD